MIASRSGNLTPSKELTHELQEKFGNKIEEEFGVKLEARTIRDNAGDILNRIRKGESSRKNIEGQKADGRVPKSQSDQADLNTPQFQKAEQNRPDFINQMAEIYNELGRV